MLLLIMLWVMFMGKGYRIVLTKKECWVNTPIQHSEMTKLVTLLKSVYPKNLCLTQIYEQVGAKPIGKISSFYRYRIERHILLLRLKNLVRINARNGIRTVRWRYKKNRYNKVND